jgi:hypothetical protein
VALVAAGIFLVLRVDAVRFAWELTPWTLVLYGITTFIFISLLMFSVNLLTATRQIRGLESEEEIEEIMAPALQGESSLLSEKSTRIFQYLALVWAGTILGAAFTLVVEKFF